MARKHNITRLHRTKQTKTDAINKVEPPHKRQKIEILHGAIQYFAKFTPNFFEKTNMRQLLMKGTKLDWTTDRKTDFKKKQDLTELPCLAHYNGNKENILTTDASTTGLGVSLWRKQGNNELKPIAFASRYLNDAKKIFHRRIRITRAWKVSDSTYTVNKYNYFPTIKH